jgi:predicted nuclease of predicted toxin-antitoxin system
MTTVDLRFHADESCDFNFVHILRTIGYDVLAVSEYTRRSVDSELIEQAYRENRVLLTEDKDFGWLVFASHLVSAGVVLIRFPGNVRKTLGQAVLELVEQKGEELKDAFVVIQPGQVRISRKE